MVKLKRVILVNFNRFVKGTKRTKIDIEFPQDYHTIMIVGDNGTGKSTLASELNLLPSISDGYDIVHIIMKTTKFIIYINLMERHILVLPTLLKLKMVDRFK